MILQIATINQCSLDTNVQLGIRIKFLFGEVTCWPAIIVTLEVYQVSSGF